MNDTDYSKNRFQGCNHYGIQTGSSTGLTGVPKTTATFYSVSENGKAISRAIARKECNSCHENGLLPRYAFCPNCGRQFTEEIKEKS